MVHEHSRRLSSLMCMNQHYLVIDKLGLTYPNSFPFPTVSCDANTLVLKIFILFIFIIYSTLRDNLVKIKLKKFR